MATFIRRTLAPISAQIFLDPRYDAGQVKPRDVSDNPRCSECKSGDMFHPEHKWGPCIVILPGRGACPCRAHEEAALRG